MMASWVFCRLLFGIAARMPQNYLPPVLMLSPNVRNEVVPVNISAIGKHHVPTPFQGYNGGIAIRPDSSHFRLGRDDPHGGENPKPFGPFSDAGPFSNTLTST